MPTQAWLAIAGLMLAVPAAAQPAPPSPVDAGDRAAMAKCLGESGRAPSACIGSIALVCTRRAAGERRLAEITCARREAAVWRERMESAVASLDGRLEAPARARLQSVQRAWATYADLKCGFIDDVLPAGRAPVLQAACEMREVAERAIHVERLLRRLARTR